MNYFGLVFFSPNLNTTTMTESENTCVICLEGEKCYKMSLVLNYTKECECDCIVHASCLRKWHESAHNKCLICKKIVFIRNSNFNKIVPPDVYEFQENMTTLIKFMILVILFYGFLYISCCFYIQFNNTIYFSYRT